MGLKKKKIVRQEMSRLLTHLDPRWVTAASNEVCAQLVMLLKQLPADIEHILAWSSFFPGEANLTRFIEQSLESYQIYLPRVLNDATMRFVSIGHNWSETIQPGPFGVLEPSDDGGALYLSEDAARTIVLVPGLAFDKRGDRIGRGKGCYDRFFARPGMNEALKVGVGFSIQVLADVPMESHDMLMDWICTEEGFYPGIIRNEDAEYV